MIRVQLLNVLIKLYNLTGTFASAINYGIIPWNTGVMWLGSNGSISSTFTSRKRSIAAIFLDGSLMKL